MTPQDLSTNEKILLCRVARVEDGIYVSTLIRASDEFKRLASLKLIELVTTAALGDWKCRVTPHGREVALAIAAAVEASERRAALTEDEHGIAEAAYRRDAGGLTPTLTCLCGHEVDGENWESAGVALDAHLKENAS